MTVSKKSGDILRLCPWGETAGQLNNLQVNDGVLLARIGKYVLELPVKMEYKLRPLLGEKISLLHTDEPHRPYLVRVVSANEEKGEGS